MKFLQSDLSDMPLVLRFFDGARKYQKLRSYNEWPIFDCSLIKTEVNENRHWKLTEGENVLAFFSVLYQDPVIWGDADREPSVYLHRIVVNPAFKGNKVICHIRDWAVTHAKQLNKKYVRMDTWGDNAVLRDYYISCGFPYIGQARLQPKKGEQPHYGGNLLSLFQLTV